METEERDVLAAELATRIVTARVAAAAGRPTAAEAHDAADYFRVIVDEVRAVLGLAPITDNEGGDEG